MHGFKIYIYKVTISLILWINLNFTVLIYGLISLGLAFLVSKLGMILQVSAVTEMSNEKFNFN